MLAHALSTQDLTVPWGMWARGATPATSSWQQDYEWAKMAQNSNALAYNIMMAMPSPGDRNFPGLF